MNMSIYCKAVKVHPECNGEVKLRVDEIDKMSLLEEITDKIPLMEILKLYEREFVKELAGDL